METGNRSNKEKSIQIKDMPWYVMRDLKRPNANLPAWKDLKERGFDVFTPMCERIVKVKGRTERQMKPCLPDLLFVNAEQSDLDAVVGAIPTLQYRFVRGAAQATPMEVSAKDMEKFISAVGSTDIANVRYYSPGELTPDMYGKTVKIIGGPLDGQSVRLLKLRGLRKKHMIVEIPSLLTATIEVNPEFIELHGS